MQLLSFEEFEALNWDDLYIEFHELGMNYEMDNSLEQFTEKRYEEYVAKEENAVH
jgi:hypothetical protein